MSAVKQLTVAGSYSLLLQAGEIVLGARFVSIFKSAGEDGVLSVDIRKLDDLERVSV